MLSPLPFVSLLATQGPAWAVGGALVGGIGQDVPTSAGTQVSLAPSETGTTVIVTVQVARDTDALALLWPAPNLDPTSAVPAEPRWLARMEAQTRPRVERLTCKELVETTHWPTPPGCSSYDYVPPEPARGEDASETVSAAPTYAPVDIAVEVIEPEALEAWLLSWGLALDPGMAAALQPHLDAGEPILTVRPTGPVSSGQWLPPVRFRLDPGEIVLPLTLGTAAASTRHELHVYALTDEGQPDPEIVNYPRAYIEDDCLLPAGVTGREWMALSRQAIEESAALPTWVLEHAASAATCHPCTDAPLDASTLAALGRDLDLSQARLSRLWMSALPLGFDEDVIVSFEGLAGAAQADLHFYAHDEALEFAFPVCGQGLVDNPGTCPNVRLPGSGCSSAGSVGRLLPLGLLGGLAALLGRRRQALLALLVALCLCPLPALAIPPDLSPRTELQGGLALLGTDRIVPEGLRHGAPWVGNPYVGISLRQSLWGWRDGRSVGVLGSVRGLWGRAAPWGEQGVLSFTLLEPSVSLDVRHGRFLEKSPCAFVRYGVGLALPVLLPSVSPPKAVPSGMLHVGYGLWLGRGLRRYPVELRLGLIPRTDGYQTRYHPNTGLPGFTWYPGTINVWLLGGAAWYGPH